jgi:nucleoside-diphosphate-sugar epimerase
MSGDITLIERSSTGTKNILESASRTPSIKRFVYTSTCCAAAEPEAGSKVHLEPDMWNETSLKKAQAEPPHPPHYGFLVYYAAKVEAEKLAWDFIKEKSPSFVFNSILLNFNMGPFIFNDHPGGSGGLVKGIYEGDPMLIGLAQAEIMIPSQQCVDVRDTARLHLAALIEEDVKSERLFSAAFPYSYNGLIKAFKALAPEGKQLPDIIEGLAESEQTANNARSEELLKRLGRPGWGRPEDFIRDNILGEVN